MRLKSFVKLLTTSDFNYMLAPLGEIRKVSSGTELRILESYIVKVLEMVQYKVFFYKWENWGSETGCDFLKATFTVGIIRGFI